MSRGFVLFAYNNSEIDYVQMALINALMIKKNLKENNITVITDGCFDYLEERYTQDIIEYAFDNIFYITNTKGKNYRVFRGGATRDALDFRNMNRPSVYELSPYDETVMLDVDYLILDNQLDKVWGSFSEFMMNRRCVLTNHTTPRSEERLDPTGIPMYWATACYFTKSETNKSFFDMVNVIKDNYDYYKNLYQFPFSMYRNDFSFSVALHMLNGFMETPGFAFAKPLPTPYVYTSPETDEIMRIPTLNEIIIKTHTDGKGEIIPIRVKQNVHVMNKYSITRHAPTFIEHYAPEGVRVYK